MESTLSTLLLMRIAFLIFFLLSFTVSSEAQTYREWQKAAKKFESEKNFAAASYAWKVVFEMDSSNLENTFMYAESLRKSWDYPGAIRLYEKVYKSDRGREYPTALLWLAVVQKDLGDYKNSKRNFRRALSKFRRNKASYGYLRITAESENFKLLDLRGKKDSIEVELSAINRMTPGQVHGISNSDSTVYFSLINFDDSLELTRLFNTTFDKKSISVNNTNETIIPGNFTGLNLTNPALTNDGNRLYFTSCERPGSCKILMLVKSGNGWSEPVELSEKVNQPNSSNTHPSVSRLEDGSEVLFFSSDRDSAKGMDIYFTLLDKEGYPGIVRPAGEPVNSLGDEITPFYNSIEKKLYFSSDFLGGYGGFDIFSSEGTPGEFEKPYNLLPPFNSYSNDFHFSNSQGKKGFLISNRQENDNGDKKHWACGNQAYYFEINTEDEDTITIKDALDRLKKYIPLTLYFHNDEPNPRSLDTLTTLTYPETYEEYMKLIPVYVREYQKGLPNEELEDAEIDIRSFFEDEVMSGRRDLDDFSDILTEVLEEGLDVTLTIKGYASTLAKSDYNINLAKRRISSLKNFIYKTENGKFLPYLENTTDTGAHLVITEIPFGEFKAAPDVSDNLNDLRNSVYSRRAALERKIEILAVDVTYSPDSIPETVSETFRDSLYYDFGYINYGEEKEIIFELENPGTEPLSLLRAIASCGCTVAELPKDPIKPGEKGTVRVRFDSKGKFGDVLNSVIIKTDGEPEQFILEIRADVVQ